MAPSAEGGVGRILTVAAERCPDADAVIDGERRIGYGALDARVNRVAAALRALGVGRGDHVVFLLKNHGAHVTAYWACQKTGAIATPLNWRYSEGEARYCIEDATAVVVMFESASRDAVLAARGTLPAVKAWIYAGDDAPFFDLASIHLRGIQAGRYVDNTGITTEAELRWDVTRRWTLVGFGGVGLVADEFDELDDADAQCAGGTGFRYMIARKYDLRLGCDVAHGPEDWAFYITVGTGWLRD